MTVQPTITLTDQEYAFAKSLVECGRFASIDAVLERSLLLVEREESELQARLEVIRADLDRRAAEPAISMEEMDRRFAAWQAERDAADPSDLA
jgi:antitoxin ParD1/3/4